MERIPVESSMVSEVGYDEREQAMEVVFTSGRVYRYEEVPRDIFDGLLAAESKGRYMHSHILGAFPERLVTRGKR